MQYIYRIYDFVMTYSTMILDIIIKLYSIL